MTPTTERGAVVELEITAIGAAGDGVAWHGGERCFVPYTLPGDRVRARITGRRGGALAAELVERLANGPHRAEPACRHFGDCGGCALQHLDDGYYADWKRQRVTAALARRGLGDVAVEALLRVAAGSRRRASLLAVRRKTGVLLGFRGRASHRVVDLGECPVLEPSLVALLAPLRGLFGDLLAPGQRAEVLVTALASGIDLVLSGPEPGLVQRESIAAFAAGHDMARVSWRAPDGGPPEIVVQRRAAQAVFGGVAVDLPPGAFLQPSAAGEELLCGAVVAATAGARRIADLYAGCGTFSFALAREATVHAVEGDAAMAAAITVAAARAGLAGRIASQARDLDRLPLLADELAGFDAVVFDPPRAGARRQAEALAASAVPLVVAVSCHPGTFARDARILVDGGYRIERVVPLDQFLWSPHVELVAVFRRG